MAALPAHPELNNVANTDSKLVENDTDLQNETHQQRAVSDSQAVGGHAKPTTEQNPELLHWRANRLMDEMMLGAVDIAASDSVPARALSSAYSPAANAGNSAAHHIQGQNLHSQNPQGQGASGRADNQMVDNRARAEETRVEQRAYYDNYRTTGSVDRSSLPVSTHSTDIAAEPTVAARPTAVSPTVQQFQQEESANEDYLSSHGATADANRLNASSAHSSQVAAPRRQVTSGDDRPTHENADRTHSQHRRSSTPPRAQPQPRNGTEQWLFAAEQRYEQLATRHQAQNGNDSATGYEYDGWSLADEAQPKSMPHGLVTPYSRENNYEELSSYMPEAARQSEKSAPQPPKTKPEVNGKPGWKNLRSNLLPRMNALDNRAVQQEMALLQNGIESVLSEGHEVRVRAQHLLQKAATIVQNDPTRSAEVDYYLQQVRMILKRAQETAQWSDLYKNRLRTYLLAWLALSVIFIVSRFLFAESLSTLVGRMSGQSSSSLLVYNLLTIATAFFFGALGGGVGAFVNLWRHTREGRGFFDRKYGLRGLILPIIGAICGLLLCLVFGIVYAVLGVEPTASLWFGLVPALLALLLGASQEHFYGTIAP